jgi:hypothetical protein
MGLLILISLAIVVMPLLDSLKKLVRPGYFPQMSILETFGPVLLGLYGPCGLGYEIYRR